MDILFNILDAMEQGSDRPTQIMGKANINWAVLLSMLTALVNHQMVLERREAKRTAYNLTEKGRTLLGVWSKVREQALVVVSDAGSYESMPKSVSEPQAADSSVLSSLVARLKATGFAIRDDVVVGRSGVGHRFNVVAEAYGGSKHGFLVYDKVDEMDIISAFMKRMDTQVNVHMVYSKAISDEAARLTASYSIRAVPLKLMLSSDLMLRTMYLGDALLSSNSLLISVDPTLPYEQAVKTIANELEARNRDMLVFTSKVSPVHKSLTGGPRLKFFLMTSNAGGVSAAGDGKFVIPANDTAILLDTLQRNLRQAGKGSSAMIFDSISDLILELGLEKSYEFLKQANEIVDETDCLGIYVMKNGAHDQRTDSFIKSLIQNHVVYDASGLNMTRSAMPGGAGGAPTR